MNEEGRKGRNEHGKKEEEGKGQNDRMSREECVHRKGEFSRVASLYLVHSLVFT